MSERRVIPLLIAFFCAISQFVSADFEWTMDYESNDVSLNGLLSTNFTSMSFSSMMGTPEEEEMYQNFKKYVSGKRKDTKALKGKGIYCEGKDSIYRNKVSMDNQYLCFDENGTADCAVAGLYLNALLGKKQKEFYCNQPCGCWVGNPKVKKARFWIRTVKDEWSALEEQLDKWSVPRAMKKDYKAASLFQGGGFQNFDLFLHAGSSAEFEQSVGAVRRLSNGRLQVGFLDTMSVTWLATRFKTKREPYYEYQYKCKQEYNSRTQQWENNCRQDPVYVGDIRTPKGGIQSLRESEITAITNAMQWAAYEQLQDIINEKKP